MGLSLAIDNVNKQVIETILKMYIPQLEAFGLQNVIGTNFFI